MNYRCATLNDLADIYHIEQELFGEHAYPYFVLRQYYDCHSEGFLVAEENGQVVGYVLHARGHQQAESWILALGIRSAVQGQGIGKQLMEMCLSSTRTDVKLTVDPENQNACRLYQKLGFELLVHDDAYFGEGEARWVMGYKQRPDSIPA